ncbi:glycogen debranching protein [Spirulina sp. CS-785/01]|uniref:glycogen debranching protein n=1 Tax=Spirulina sp. CS-785/01 TaxID=3021716 RepID=UPI00232FEF4B|nr:glycogen debranching protein [Spirulina sp. CS-785/01]MDB9313240.1 glycogen debranching protein [Spirulina sp. CS-785/01]
MTIWINEQVDPSGMIHACIASCNEELAKDCHESFEKNLTQDQKDIGWQARIREVETWEEVPVNSLKLS